ncbi:hypothetical protein ACFFQF_23620 [Haladaptatus pallidirubidus]|uniref:DUF7344 domain-containing protein n=1 Tax=Haladaptatus pallidirubidus TaxID=1008152 RepID=A0AAV3UNA0_9EURY|nr:hypothetical protein [Haladaptatus pallidirubidus]
MSEPDTEPTLSVTIDDVLQTLANHHRRQTLSYLSSTADSQCTVDELVAHLQAHPTETEYTERQLRQRLHHIHLPKLMDVGLLTYESNSQQIQYSSHPQAESLLAYVESIREGAEPKGTTSAVSESAVIHRFAE